MDRYQFLSAVQDTGGVTSQEQAEKAAIATLTALGERLDGGETSDLAAQLPRPLDACLPEQGEGERFGVEEFYGRVARYEGTDPQHARQHARAVVAAIKGGITGDEFDQIVDQLPQEYGDLLGTGPVQH